MRYFFALSLFLVCANNCLCQEIDQELADATVEQTENFRFTPSAWSGRINRDFARLLGASGENVSVGSFASLDLLNPRFNFNGAIPIVPSNKTKLIKILALNAQGELDAANIGYIFTDRKKSSSARLSAALHWGLKFHRADPGNEELSLLQLTEYSIRKKNKMAHTLLDSKSRSNQDLASKYSYQTKNLEVKKRQLERELDPLKEQIDGLRVLYFRNLIGNSGLEKLSKLTKTLSTTFDSIHATQKTILKNNFLIDSLNVEMHLGSANEQRKNLLNDEARAQVAKLRNDLLFFRYRISWWTIDIEYDRSKIFQYDSLATFHSRISPN